MTETMTELQSRARQILALPAGDLDEDEAMTLGGQIISADPELAARVFHHVALGAEQDERPTQLATALQQESAAWSAAGRVPDAVAAAHRTRETAMRVTDIDVRHRVLNNLAVGMKEIGMADAALEILDEVIAHWRPEAAAGSMEATDSLAASLVNRATVLIDQGHVDDGVASLHEAEQMAQIQNNLIRIGTIKINLAFVHSTRGELRQARDAYREAGDLYHRGGAGSRDIGYALRGEASTLAQVGRYDDAIGCYERARTLFLEENLLDEVVRTEIGRLMAQVSRGDRIGNSDLDQLEQQLQHIPLNERGQLGRNLGNIALEQDDSVRAERLYLLARESFQNLDRHGDVASVDTNRAVAARRAGSLDRAQTLFLNAREVLVRLARWRQVGQIDHNLALVMVDMSTLAGADTESLQQNASKRSQSAVAALDRFRHDLPSARDRIGLEQQVYPQIFPLAIQTALKADRPSIVASLVERARIQPVLPSSPQGMAFLEPRPIAARPGDEAVGGNGKTVVLAEQAIQLAGPDAIWAGWWHNDTDVVAAFTTMESVHVAISPRVGSMALLATALAIPTPEELHRNDGRDGHVGLLALWRAARGPLLNDPALADRLARVLAPGDLAASLANETVAAVIAMDDTELLWPVSRMLFGDDLLQKLQSAAQSGERVPLVLAPPPLLGRIPWAALPLAEPGTAVDYRLVEAANIVIAPPASLVASLPATPPRSGGILLVADPLGDLRHARTLDVPGAQRLGFGQSPATFASFATAAKNASMLVLAAHVRPGQPADPAASAILLSSDDGVAELAVADLATLTVPPICVLLCCDGAGAATGNEWTGVATGLIWAGASWVVTTMWPEIEDRISRACDEELIACVRREGPREGLWQWQRAQAAASRTGSTAPIAAYRWASFVVIGSPRNTR